MNKTKRRDNMLYKLRKHGIRADVKEKVIFIPYESNPWEYPQVRRLQDEFYFNIQYVIV